jgi:hypothetical protein
MKYPYEKFLSTDHGRGGSPSIECGCALILSVVLMTVGYGDR